MNYRRRTITILCAVSLLATACSSSSASKGTGLLTGTVANEVAATLFVGMSAKEAQSAFNGKPVTELPGKDECQEWRGVDIHVSRLENKATGNLWTICYALAKVVAISHTCPTPWREGEFERYQKAGYSADPSDCTFDGQH